MPVSAHVSVIVPVHNCEEYIAAAVQSVLDQHHDGLDVIVVDDGSTDASTAALAPFLGKIRLVQQRKSGPAAARNAGLRVATGSYIAFLDADDWWFGSRLAAQLAAFTRFPDVGIAFSDFCVVNATSRTLMPSGIRWKYPLVSSAKRTPWLRLFTEMREINWTVPSRDTNSACAYKGHIANWLFQGNFVNTSSVLARRDALERAGGFDEKLETEEDYDCWLRLAAEWPFVYLDAPLVAFRRRAGQLTAQDQADNILRNVAFVVERAASQMPADTETGAVRSRLSRIHCSLGIACLRKGLQREARHHLLRSMGEQPVQALAAALLPLTLLPAGAFARLERILRAVRRR